MRSSRAENKKKELGKSAEMRSRLYFENVSRPHTPPTGSHFPHPPAKWRPIYTIYYMLYTYMQVPGGGGIYRTEHVQHVRRFVCLFFYFAVWPAKLMQKQMVSNMHKKKGKCDKPEGDA